MDSWKVNFFGASAVLICGAFVFGVYIGNGEMPEIEKVSSVINKNNDVITADVGSISNEKADFVSYWRVWNTLDRKFIPFGTSTGTNITEEDKIYSSIEGLVSSYNDPYTVFMRPKVSKNFKIRTKGSLEGIGAIIGERDGELLVVKPLPSSPAEKAGLVAGDKILSVDGVSVKGMSVDDAVNLIRGEGGTVVVLSVKSEGVDEIRDVSITRGIIEIPSTAHAVIARNVPKKHTKHTNDNNNDKFKKDNKNDISGNKNVSIETEKKDFYVLRLFSFSQTSINAFERELKDFVKSGSDALIIDLRGNPGGYIESAVQIASWFLPPGSVVVRERVGPDKKLILHKSKDKKLFNGKLPKIAILVDKGTASASEILSGALQEYGVATIVGTHTFGKGCVQELVNITDKLSLKVTVARWYTPNDISISNGGLTPDIVVDTSATSSDPWIDAAVNAISIE